MGWQFTLLTLLLAVVLGGVAGSGLLVLRIKKRKDFIPFGPFIACGAFLVMLYGKNIITWYLKIL